MELLVRIADVSSRANLEAALRQIGDQFQAATGTLHAVGANGSLDLIASFGVPPQLQSVIASIPIGKGIAGAAAQQREPVTICNIQTDSSGVTRPGAKSTGVEGAIAVPILDDGESLVGVLGIGKPHAHTYTVEEMRLLLRLAAGLANDLRALH